MQELFSLDAGWSVDGTTDAADDDWGVAGRADALTDSESDGEWEVESGEASSSDHVQQVPRRFCDAWSTCKLEDERSDAILCVGASEQRLMSQKVVKWR